MEIKKKFYDLRRKYFGRYEVEDPRLTAKESPYTFYLPSKARIDALELGDSVQVIIRSVPVSYKYGAERMWVDVIDIEDEDFKGKLANIPFDIPQLKLDDIISFKSWHIIDMQWKNPEKEKVLPSEPSKQIWDRCMVDKEIVNGTARVGYIYREEPDLGQDDDKNPDSGWRIRADVRDLTDEEYDNPDPMYIAIGKVLNKDDSWLHLIGSEIGSKFLRNKKTEEFEVTD